MIAAAAQTIPKDGNIEANIADHCRLSKLAASQGAQLILFPELSLTGYVRETAASLAFTPNDTRLKPLQEIAASHHMIIVAGAPLLLGSTLYIGAFLLFPDYSIALYTKQFLHEGEEVAYIPGTEHNPTFELGGEKIAIAICADITHGEHAANAAAKGTTLYLAGIFYTPNGIAEGHTNLSYYAGEHKMNVLMANYGGPSYTFDAAGQSAFWTKNGTLTGGLTGTGEGLIIAHKQNETWTVTVMNSSTIN